MKKIRTIFDLIKSMQLFRALLLMGFLSIVFVLFIDNYFVQIKQVTEFETSHSLNDVLIYIFSGTAPDFLSEYILTIILILPILMFMFQTGMFLDFAIARGKYSIIRMNSLRYWWNGHVFALFIQIIIVILFGIAVTFCVSSLIGLENGANLGFFKNHISNGIILNESSSNLLERLINYTNIDVVHSLALFVLRIISIIMLQTTLYIFFRKKAVSILLPVILISFISLFPQLAIYIPIGLTMYATVLYFDCNIIIAYGSTIILIICLYVITAKKVYRLEWM